MIKWLSSMPGITGQFVPQIAERHVTVELPGDLHTPAAWSWLSAQRVKPARQQGLTPSVYAVPRSVRLLISGALSTTLTLQGTPMEAASPCRVTFCAGCTTTHLCTTATGLLLYFAHLRLLRSFLLTFF